MTSSPSFSAKGNRSGSLIVNGKWEMVGLLHSGKSKTGTTATCVTYATPAWRLLELIKENAERSAYTMQEELKTTRRRSRRDVFKGPIQGYIHHAGGRGEVVAYNEYVEVRGTSSTRVVHKLDTPFRGVERFAGGTYENRGNPLGERRGIQQAQRPPSQVRDPAESRAIFEDLLRRAARAGPGRSANQIRTNPAIESGNPRFRGLDERSENAPVFNFRLLEQEFLNLSPDMQRYLVWLQNTTKSEHLFAHRDQTHESEELSQR